MGEQLRLVIVGFGRVVELIHLPALRRVPQIEIAGVYDITPERAALAAKRGFSVYTSVEEWLAAPHDAVLVATPPSSHYAIASQALRGGKHVLLEKPATVNADEAVELQRIAEAEGRTITAFHNRRFDGDFRLVKRMIAEDELGRILFVTRRHHMFGSGASFGVKSFHPNWRNEARFGGGALLDWGVHLADQLNRLELGNGSAVRATMHGMRWEQGDVDDYVHASIATDTGVLLTFEVNFASHAAEPAWIVGGERATLLVHSDREAYVRAKGQSAQAIAVPPTAMDGPQRVYASFADRVLHGGKLEIAMEEVVETMRWLDAIRESARSGKEVAYGDSVHGAAVGI